MACVLWCDNNNEGDVIIEDSMFSPNIAKYGGGIDIALYGDGSIELETMLYTIILHSMEEEFTLTLIGILVLTLVTASYTTIRLKCFGEG